MFARVYVLNKMLKRVVCFVSWRRFGISSISHKMAGIRHRRCHIVLGKVAMLLCRKIFPGVLLGRGCRVLVVCNRCCKRVVVLH